MSRPLRIQYPGAVYHVTCRGNERKDIYKDDGDRKKFLDILLRSKGIYSVKVFSYVLMGNHFHLLVETPLGNLGEFMRHFNITYTSTYNRRHKRIGHLYQGRYKSIVVDKSAYLSILSRYIHLNPIRTMKMARKSVKEKIGFLEGYLWSSLPGYLRKGKKEDLIDYEMVLEEHGGDNKRGRFSYSKEIHNDVAKGLEVKDKLIGQSILGKEPFIAWIKKNYLNRKEDRDCSQQREVQRYKAKEEVISAVEVSFGKGIEEIKKNKGSIRQITMDLLYRIGGLKGVEIGRMMGVDYSTVSQGRKRLREKMKKDKALRMLVNQIEQRLSI